jgi:hypothetical protein
MANPQAPWFEAPGQVLEKNASDIPHSTTEFFVCSQSAPPDFFRSVFVEQTLSCWRSFFFKN